MLTSDEGRVALISGANRGIGKAIATELLARGWQLSLGVRDPAKLPETLRSAHAQAFDATDTSAERRWVDAAVERFGRIDAVIANAGIIVPKSLVDLDDSDMDAMLQVNVRSPMRLVKAAWPQLEACGRGRVVTVVSLSGKRVKSATSGPYSVSKFAALALNHAIRQTGWDAGIRATAICPGFVATDMAFGVTDHPPEAMTDPGDIAKIVALVLDLPNTASVSEVPINCLLDDSY